MKTQHRTCREEIIDISEYIGFAKRHKITITAAIVLFLAAAYFIKPMIPARHTLSVTIIPPSVKCPAHESPPPYRCTRILARRINQRRFAGRADELILKLNARANTRENRRPVRIECVVAGYKGLEKSSVLFEELLSEIKAFYEPAVSAERQRLENLLRDRKARDTDLAERIKEIQQSGQEQVAAALEAFHAEIRLLKSIHPEGSVEGLESLLSGLHNIIVIEQTRVMETAEPETGMSMAIAGFTGLIVGIIIGFAKDRSKRGKNK